MVKIVVRTPGDWPPEKLAEISKSETARAMQFLREGRLRRIWRIVGQRANFSVWDVNSLEELHATLTSLPLHPYMEVEVHPLIKHTTTMAWEAEHGELPPF